MFFTRVGLIIAYIGFVLSAFRIGLAVFIAFGAADMSANAALAQRFFGAANTGEAITTGTYGILFSVVLGTLCEISRRLKSS